MASNSAQKSAFTQRSALVQSSIVTRVASAHHLPASDLRTQDLFNKSSADILVPAMPKPPTLSPPGTRGSRKVRNFTNNYLSEDNVHGMARGADKSPEPKNTHRLNPIIVQTWLNDTLKENKEIGLPQTLLKAEKRTPLSIFGIDRATLFSANINHDTIDRLYRALFVYSLGFYELLTRSLSHAENKHFLITNFWKAFALLLQNCCRSDYQLTVARIEQQHKAEMFQLNSEHRVWKQNQESQFKELKSKFSQLQKMLSDLETKYEDEKQRSVQMENEMRQSAKNQEQEVQLRLRFESKLNQLHSVQREMENRYARAQEELIELQEKSKDFSKIQNTLKMENSKLRAKRAELDSQLKFEKETVGNLVKEIDNMRKKSLDLQMQLNEKILNAEKVKVKNDEQRRQIMAFELKMQAEKSNLEAERQDKDHIKVMYEEAKQAKRALNERVDRLEEEKIGIVRQLQEKERTLIGKLEIEKSQAERIERMQRDNNELIKTHGRLQDVHSNLNVHFEANEAKRLQLEKDLKVARETLEITNTERMKLEHQLKNQGEKINSLEESARSMEESKQSAERQWNKYEKRYEEVNRKYHILVTEKERLLEEMKHVKWEMGKKCDTLKGALREEGGARAQWATKYDLLVNEMANEKHKLSECRRIMKDNEIQINELQQQVALTKNELDITENNRLGLQDKVNGLSTENDQLGRTKVQLEERIRLLKETHQEQLKEVKAHADARVRLAESVTNMVGMEHEDYRMRLILESERLKHAKEEVKKLRGKLERTERLLAQEKEEMIRRKESYNKLVVEHMGMKGELEEVKETLTQREQKIEEMKKESQDQQEIIDHKEEEVVEGRREIGALKEELETTKTALLFYTSKKFVNQETDTAELDAIFTPRGMGSRVERIMATTPSSRTASRNKRATKNNWTQTQHVTLSPQSQMSSSINLTNKSQKNMQTLRSVENLNTRGHSHPNLPNAQLPNLLRKGQAQLNPDSASSANLMTLQQRAEEQQHQQYFMREDRSRHLQEGHSDSTLIQGRSQMSHRRPVETAQKMISQRSGIRPPDGRERYSVYSSHRSLEGNQMLHSVYTTAQLQGQRVNPEILTPPQTTLISDPSFPDIRPKFSSFQRTATVRLHSSGVRGRTPAPRREGPLSTSMLLEGGRTMAVQDDREVNQTALADSIGSDGVNMEGRESPQEVVQEIRVDVSRTGSGIASSKTTLARQPVAPGVLGSIQSQDSLAAARRTLNTAGSMKMMGQSSNASSSYRLTRGGVGTRSGSTAAATGITHTLTQGQHTSTGTLTRPELYRPSINQSVGSNIKRMIRAAAARPQTGNR